MEGSFGWITMAICLCQVSHDHIFLYYTYLLVGSYSIVVSYLLVVSCLLYAVCCRLPDVLFQPTYTLRLRSLHYPYGHPLWDHQHHYRHRLLFLRRRRDPPPAHHGHFRYLSQSHCGARQCEWYPSVDQRCVDIHVTVSWSIVVVQ